MLRGGLLWGGTSGATSAGDDVGGLVKDNDELSSLAGWTAGAAWAVGWWMLARWLEERGAVEPEAQTIDEPADSAAP